MKTLKYIIVMALLGCLWAPASFAQYKPSDLAKSLVQLTITGGGKGKGAASGFIWKEKKYLVTSLHAMRKGDDVNVKVKWSGSPGAWSAEVVKIHKEGDLALLEIAPGDLGLPDWVPLNDKSTEKLPYQAVMHALGYNSGAKKWSSRRLYKGEGQTDKLKDLIPSKDVSAIKKLGMPSLELDVLYIEGSLLPGFSGSPIVNNDGVLVGISDGGLENGASNVSWGIPATHLEKLMASEVIDLPDNMESISQTFSAEIDAPEDYKVIEYDDFSFVHTKTRTLYEMLETADNPEYILEEIESFQEMGGSPESVSFDIYEDINHGVVVSVPSGVEVVQEEGMLSVYYDDYTYISYSVFKDDSGNDEITIEDLEEIEDEFINAMPENLYYNIEDEQILKTNVGQLATFEISFSEYEDAEIPSMYVLGKMAFADGVGLLAVSFVADVTEENLSMIESCLEAGNDCYSGAMQGCEQTCTTLNKWLAAISSVSLTTFANSWTIE